MPSASHPPTPPADGTSRGLVKGHRIALIPNDRQADDRESSQDLADRFRDLAEQWQHETWMLSNTRQALAHPAHGAIVGLGDPVVPLILERMRTRGGHWCHALYAITQANPVNPADHGNVAAIQQAWLGWGRDHGRI